MFEVRGLMVSSAVFVLVYALVSALVVVGWKYAARGWRRRSAASQADRFLALRLLPFLSAAAVTSIFTIPSFVMFEPRSGDEDFGIVPMTLAVFGMAFLIAGIWRAAVAVARTNEAMDACTREARIDGSGEVPVVRIAGVKPALMAAGIARPKVLLSDTVEFLLTPRELQTALRHELGHIRRHDNIKKLALFAVPFPGMSELEAMWSETSEMAADDVAVANESDALDLAAALIKLSGAGVAATAPLASSLLHGPAKSLNARVARLLAWSERVKDQSAGDWKRSALASITVLAGLAVVYTHLLMPIHSATEWLVR